MSWDRNSTQTWGVKIYWLLRAVLWTPHTCHSSWMICEPALGYTHHTHTNMHAYSRMHTHTETHTIKFEESEKMIYEQSPSLLNSSSLTWYTAISVCYTSTENNLLSSC